MEQTSSSSIDARDLQEMALPVLVFGGPYGNYQAVSRLKETADALGIPGSRTICTGDTVAYCAQPNETVAAIREWGTHVISGNVEIQLAAEKDDCGCNFQKGSVCDALSQHWYAYVRSRLRKEHIHWMGALPRSLEFTSKGRRFAVVHGTRSETARYVFRSTEWDVKHREIELAGADVVIGGHCGLPFIHAENGKVWANAGAIGMPANDGTPRVWALLVSAAGGELRLRTFPVDYDFQEASGRMTGEGLPKSYAETLISGLWPGCEILPPEETGRRGIPLEPADVTLFIA